MTPETKDWFEVASKTVAIIGGLVSAAILILALQASTSQQATELRWTQARLAMDLVDDTMNDPTAFKALNMIDWENKEYQNGSNKVAISSAEVEAALNVENNNNLQGNGEFIRESFDRLFYHLGKIERSLASNLTTFEDVRSPMDYYIPFLRSKYARVLILYMKQLHHDDALRFLNRFQSWSVSSRKAHQRCRSS